MKDGARAPVLVQRELVLARGRTPDPVAIEKLVSFQRSGRHLLLVAEQPARWRPTRRAVDHDLALQQQIHQCIRRAGAELDGMVYLATGLFARRQARLDELDQLAERYDRSAADLTIVAHEPILLQSVLHSGGRALAVGESGVTGATAYDSLQEALESLG